MKALISRNKVVDIAEVEFEVHPSLTWMSCPDDCVAGGWELVSGNLQVIPEPEDTRNWEEKRKDEYNLLNQFEMRYDDLVNNTTTWRDGIAAIKAAHPKP